MLGVTDVVKRSNGITVFNFFDAKYVPFGVDLIARSFFVFVSRNDLFLLFIFIFYDIISQLILQV